MSSPHHLVVGRQQQGPLKPLEGCPLVPFFINSPVKPNLPAIIEPCASHLLVLVLCGKQCEAITTGTSLQLEVVPQAADEGSPRYL